MFMKAFHLPPSSRGRGVSVASTSSLRRAAFARPRVLLSVMTVLTAAGTWWAVAQREVPKSSAAPVIKPVSTHKPDPNRRPLTWDRLPQMVSDYGLRRGARALGKGNSPTTAGLPAIGPNRFPLTEMDLTPGNISDEREPDYRTPTGDLIAFASNGVDLVNNGTGVAPADGRLDGGAINAENRYHIWIMRRDGSQQRQVTGLGSDRNFNQRTPSWSPDGRRIVYVGDVSATSAATRQLFIVDNVLSSTSRPVTQPITFFGGNKRDPAWSPSGDTIAFAANAAPTSSNQSTPLGQFDIFTVSPTGSTLTVRRLTGDPDGRSSGSPSPTDPQDLTGNSTDDWNPAYSQVNPGVLFFSTNRQSTVTVTGTPPNQTSTVTVAAITSGRRIFAMNSFNGSLKRQITDPTARAAGAAGDSDDHPSASLFKTFFGRGFDVSSFTFTERVAFETDSRIDSSDKTPDLNIWSVPVTTTSLSTFLGTGTPLPPVENKTATTPVIATVESNLLSSPAQQRAAGFVGATEDKSADREPSFSRANATRDLISPIAFASQRRVAPRPGPNGLNPAPTIINPGGGNVAASTHDIWTTVSEDTTPPLLVPVSTGNQQFPFVAPGRQAPFFAPRTAEEGLNPGGKVIVAVVLSEPESGLVNARGTTGPSVSVQIKDADNPQFLVNTDPRLPFPFRNTPNEDIPVQHFVEQPPLIVAGPLKMDVFDDGPRSQGGNELQANAIKGDGIYYAQASITAVDASGKPLEGDYYLDLITTDRAGNSLTYDHVYGFSTRPFRKSEGVNLLYVSDYTVGQTFPATLLNGPFADAGGRTQDVPVPIESYWLLNPGGIVGGGTTPGLGIASQDIAFPTSALPADQTTFSPPDTYLPTGRTDFSTFGLAATSTDIWRILSRGELPIEVLRLYSPQLQQQLDPNADPDNDSVPGPFADSTRPVTVAETAVLWSSPYTGSVFSGPGTIFDVEAQRRLTDFLTNGGRLFMSGQDIIFALSNAGTVTNPFLQQELRADWDNETPPGDEGRPTFGFTLGGNAGDPFIVNRDFYFFEERDPPTALHVPYNPADNGKDSYWDAADNDFFLDIIKPVAKGTNEDIVTLYEYGNAGIGGQRIEKRERGQGFTSRVVFFGFGLEMINREYTKATKLAPVRNHRAKVADNIANYLRTGRVSGRVINAATNVPIPNFLVQVADPTTRNRFFLTRTDENGNYEIAGIPSRDGFYRVSPAVFNDATTGEFRSLNPGFFANNSIFAVVTVLGGRNSDDVNFRVNPSPPSTVTGRAISDRGTFAVDDDDDPDIEVAPNVPVLLRTPAGVILPPSNRFPAGGPFAILEQTDASGRFVFQGVPSDLPFEIVFNPRPQRSDGSGKIIDNGDIPPGTGIIFNNTTSQIRPNPNFGRRVIPVDPAYNGPRPPGVLGTGATLLVTTGTTLDIGDIPIPLAGSTVSGRVLRNGVAVSGAKVELILNGVVTQTATTGTDGRYSFDNVQPGSYTVRASLVDRGTTISGQAAVTVTRGNNVVVPNITLTTTGGTPAPGPTVRPTVTPTPTQSPANEEFQVGDLDQISIPYADSSAITATTTVAKAFTVPVGDVGNPNYRLTRYNPLTQTYEVLNDKSIIRRGEGFFIRPLRRAVSIKRPPGAPGPIGPRFADRKPGTFTEFTITLRRSPSLPNDPNSGFNLIGFPFDPARYRSISWLDSRVIAPDGRSFPTVQQAVSNGLLSAELFTLRADGTPYESTNVIEPFKGYFAKTFVDGVRVVLRARSR